MSATDLIDPPIAMCVRRGDIEATRRLIDAGFNINLRTTNEDAPLHLAARAGNLKMVQLLTEKGALTEVKNKFQQTPRDLVSNDAAAREEILKLLPTSNPPRYTQPVRSPLL
jgi:ankyrin repeat protein